MKKHKIWSIWVLKRIAGRFCDQKRNNELKTE